ncbi:tuftelin-interacting protein 11-like [Actinia tenebrosa]|uniref:Tuftelin-interacting protein 11-like n=1 Tax=Actinia tenebrosa TaxID=6105 RepID=A0A6P8I7X9_ACTTE|nr:tuftelin-interacting protein 11-like [Actinia tenebrosa]
MEEEEEVESFEITDNDIMHAGLLGLGFRPYKSSKRLKEEATYGMWAEYDSDEGDSYGRGKRKKDYSRPLSFISGGVVQKGKQNEEDEEENDDDKEENSSGSEESEHKSRTFKSKKLFKGKGVSSSYNEPGNAATQMYAKRLQKTGGKEFGSWEKHTKGFGMKMLHKMGYQPGQGLGKEGKGRVQPVEAFKREGRGALGMYGPEVKTKGKIQYDEEEEEDKKFKEKLHQWKKSSKTGKASPKYIYKTADEVKATGVTKKGPSVSLKHSKVKVVDMTGPEAKILTGYGSLSQQHAKPGEIPATTTVEEAEAAFAMPELMYNLNLLVDMTETEIVQIDKELKFEQDMVTNLKYESERIAEVINQEDKQIKRLTDVMQVIDRCRAHSLSSIEDSLTLQKCEDMFKLLQDEFHEEYMMYELSSLAIPLVFPLIKEYLSRWSPLINPTYGLDVFKTWKDLLQSGKPSAFTLSQGTPLDTNSMDIYEQLVWEVWMPLIRTAVSIWNCRDSDPMITVIEHWLPLLPPWVIENIKNLLILPRLQREVDAWNPLTDAVPIHAWIHPWLPLMKGCLEPLYAPIRYKLATALTNWHPSDPSAKMILEPWTKVFSKGSMDAFVLRSIYPKLSQCLSEFVINPHQQHLEPFHWVMTWKGVIPLQHFVSLLEKHFFPKWFQVLRNWLASNPNYDEITKWYKGWKTMFSDELLNNQSIKAQFNRALDVMNQAVSSPGEYLQPGAKEHIAYLTSIERRKEAEAAAATAALERSRAETARLQAANQNVPTNFKDLIHKMAEDNNIVFLPVPNRRYEGKTLYTLGKTTIYIDQGVVFVQTQGSWKPISLQDLFVLAK